MGGFNFKSEDTIDFSQSFKVLERARIFGAEEIEEDPEEKVVLNSTLLKYRL